MGLPAKKSTYHQSKPTRPLVRYLGGKWMLAPWIISHFPAHKMYVEPCCGGGNVLLRKDRSRGEVLNDKDSSIVNLFQIMRNPKQAKILQELLYLTPFARKELELAQQHSDDPMESARRMVVRSFMGFSTEAVVNTRKTGFRTVRSGSGDLPANNWPTYIDVLPKITNRLQGVTIENRDALEIIQRFDGVDTLHFIDPPYPTETRVVNGGKYAHEMDTEDHRNLASTLHGLKGMVIISGYQCPLYNDELYPDWYQVCKKTTANGRKGSTSRVECLWINQAAQNRRKGQLNLF
ncbi:MAG: DNA adenine methylase [Magnetococcales bacterium]|nr:DNA adenine methylase [Magnetococcales bacterium]